MFLFIGVLIINNSGKLGELKRDCTRIHCMSWQFNCGLCGLMEQLMNSITDKNQDSRIMLTKDQAMYYSTDDLTNILFSTNSYVKKFEVIVVSGRRTGKSCNFEIDDDSVPMERIIKINKEKDSSVLSKHRRKWKWPFGDALNGVGEECNISPNQFHETIEEKQMFCGVMWKKLKGVHRKWWSDNSQRIGYVHLFWVRYLGSLVEF